jgi:hypothetical protein
MMKKLVLIALVSCFLSNAWAVGPCEQIIQACTSAGFIKGQVKENNGLIRDCVNPIMQGKAVAGTAHALPTVDPAVVSACHAKKPNFGEGKVGK